MVMRMGNLVSKSTIARTSLNKVRLQHPITMEYLHMGGQTINRDVNLSWLGTRTQVAAIRARHVETGLIDGYVIVLRDPIKAMAE